MTAMFGGRGGQGAEGGEEGPYIGDLSSGLEGLAHMGKTPGNLPVPLEQV